MGAARGTGQRRAHCCLWLAIWLSVVGCICLQSAEGLWLKATDIFIDHSHGSLLHVHVHFHLHVHLHLHSPPFLPGTQPCPPLLFSATPQGWGCKLAVVSHQCNSCHSPLVACPQLACSPLLTAPSGGVLAVNHHTSRSPRWAGGPVRLGEGLIPVCELGVVPADGKNKGLSAITLQVLEARISKQQSSPD